MSKIYYLIICFLSFSVLSAQEKLSKEEKARREKNIQAGNPFTKYGSKAPVATLSKGKYLEVHDLDSIVTIGTSRWHVDNKKIVGDIIIDSLNVDAQPIGDRIGRWMSPDPLSEEAPDWTPYRFGFNNPIRYNDPTGLFEGDYFSEEGKYLGNDGIDDKKVYVAKEGSYKANDKGGYSIKNSGISELKDGEGNAVNIDTFIHLAATLYSEGSSTWEEAAGIFSVLENRASLEGTSIMEQASYEKGVYGASKDGLSKYSSIFASMSMKENANKGVILGLTTNTDYSNGGYFWDGKDFAKGGGYRERYAPGFMFSDSKHDLWNMGNNIVSGSNSYGSWNFKYKSTNAAGNTTFSTTNYLWRDAQLPSTSVIGPMGTKFGKK